MHLPVNCIYTYIHTYIYVYILEAVGNGINNNDDNNNKKKKMKKKELGIDSELALSAFLNVDQQYHEFGSPRHINRASAECLHPIG